MQIPQNMKTNYIPSILAYDLKNIERVFDTEFMLNENISNEFVRKYYKNSSWGYSFFHSKDGSVHMALNFDGKFDSSGYEAQPEFFSRFIQENKAKNILELGFGKGFNSRYVAQKNADISITGLDLTPDFYSQAQSKAKNFSNIELKLGDFHQLPFADASFDVVYEVEAVCHARDILQVLNEVFRVLKPGGHYLAYDGFRQPGFDQLDNQLRKAARLVEISMAVEKGQYLEEFKEAALKAGFEIRLLNDVSDAIMPNLMRFRRLARKFFKYKLLARFILSILPSLLVKNSVAGLLMPHTIQGNAFGYYQLVLQKNNGL